MRTSPTEGRTSWSKIKASTQNYKEISEFPNRVKATHARPWHEQARQGLQPCRSILLATGKLSICKHACWTNCNHTENKDPKPPAVIRVNSILSIEFNPDSKKKREKNTAELGHACLQHEKELMLQWWRGTRTARRCLVPKTEKFFSGSVALSFVCDKYYPIMD
jgi:hypothetical protein